MNSGPPERRPRSSGSFWRSLPVEEMTAGLQSCNDAGHRCRSMRMPVTNIGIVQVRVRERFVPVRGDDGSGADRKDRAGDQSAGNAMSKRIDPSAHEASISPPCASTIDFVIARPSPAPSPLLQRDGSTR